MLHNQGSNNPVTESSGSRDPLTLTVETQQLPVLADGETSDDCDAALAPPGSCIPGRKPRRKSDGSRHCNRQHSPGPNEPWIRQAAASSSMAVGSVTVVSSSSPSATAMHRSNSCSRELCLPTDLHDSNNKRASMQKTVKTKSPRVRDVVSRLERQLEKCNSPGATRSLLPPPPRTAQRRVRPPSMGCMDESTSGPTPSGLPTPSALPTPGLPTPIGLRTPRKSDSFSLLHA